MILFQLKCSSGHEFEAWFLNGATYDRQAAGGDIACPFCGDVHVSKAPMAPNIVGATSGRIEAEERAKSVAKQILQAVDRLRHHVENECEYVGDQFADEARRIHHGEADDRGIWGEANEEQVRELDEEGVEVHRLPPSIRKNS